MSKVTGYSRTQIALHWGVLALMIVSYVSEDAMSAAWRAFNRGQEVTPGAHTVHVISGILILVLAAMRLLARWRRGAPAAPDAGHPLMKPAAAVTHWALYALMIVIPLTGIAAWFGGIRDAGEVHEVLFNVLLLLVGLHVVGALYHQFVLKDGLMDRMRKPL
ncbi:cytochrome b/b6 domain-containing protein [Defluviimonas aestuarii]|uniref:cytochrome b n=1 Tax=Albidovulum aestuarii TaxID=1130726 RepID=UPI00249B4238|nr:cytochrome b/b6 domain-containing protein [Defluviimonas aestuarii]MDI3337001.1 cytochrome b/b6 domain-containing protein [Defluviimonas aestuarii]